MANNKNVRRYCEDCKHFKSYQKTRCDNGHFYSFDETVCLQSSGSHIEKNQHVLCRYWRDPGTIYSEPVFDSCGPEGKHWEPKKVPGADLRKTFGLDS